MKLILPCEFDKSTIVKHKKKNKELNPTGLFRRKDNKAPNDSQTTQQSKKIINHNKKRQKEYGT